MIRKLLLTPALSTLIAFPLTASSNQLTYWQAIDDAAVIEPSERLALVPILKKEVKVATWTRREHAGSYVPGNTTTLSWGDVWVTLEPEVKDVCSDYKTTRPEGDLTLRLEQLLGLPPTSDDRVFVSLLVQTDDVFRPCAQPDTSTTICNPAPQGYEMSKEHAVFYANQTMNSYKKNGYPWTRLGYTYDWSPETSDYGASEYVIKKGATVEVLAVSEQQDYCG